MLRHRPSKRPTIVLTIAAATLLATGCGSGAKPAARAAHPPATTPTTAADAAMPSSDEASSTTSTTVSPSTPIDVPVTDAAALRDRLLTLADNDGRVDDGQIASWSDVSPDLEFSAATVPASPTSVSGFTFSQEPGSDHDYLAYAVTDTIGTCAGGLITTDTSGIYVESAQAVTANVSPCTGAQVASAAGFG